MNNRDFYKETFSKLHASSNLDLEEMKMKTKGTGFRCRRSLIIVTVIMTVMMAMSAIAYAATGGQILDTVKVWIGGESKELVEGDMVQTEDGFTIKLEKQVNTPDEQSTEMSISE